ncbi:MAG: hypothetical protein LBE84_07205 [Planctomycetota bacterium]|jgi:2-dehydro-3-deoxyglucarate aldolase/4-hydroxy-2-oxoheptanedioate aldolase|nr:hypothetical protein [Planctomycetota bacterium]
MGMKDDLKAGKSLVGTMVAIVDNPDIAKILRVSGFDFIIIDNEHGYMDYQSAAGIIGMARAMDYPALVRIPEAGREVILKYAEMGASGFLLPNCETAGQARALVEYSKYAPLGNRGVALLRAHANYEKQASAVEYMAKANAQGVLMCQIESPIGVGNIDAILDVEGIDAAFIGPNDLSQSYGLMGQFSHPTVVGAIDAVIASARRRGKFSGIHFTGAPEMLQPWIAKGMTLNLWSNDITLMMTKAAEGLKTLRG